MYKIVTDESNFLIIDKSPNVHFHSQDGTSGVVASVKKDTGLDLFPVHRLDTITSGLILLAKSVEAARVFSEKFSSHTIEKYYVALAQGKPKKKQGGIIGDMAKSRRSQYKLLRSCHNPTVTHFFSFSVVPGMRLYVLKPSTGKTHQLRVVMASLATPVLGDTLYGGEVSDRGYLHAWHLAFSYNGKEYIYNANPSHGQFFSLPEVVNLLTQHSPPSKLKWPVR